MGVVSGALTASWGIGAVVKEKKEIYYEEHMNVFHAGDVSVHFVCTWLFVMCTGKGKMGLSPFTIQRNNNGFC